MEEFQIVRPSPVLAPYIKQYWFLTTGKPTQPVQRIIPTGHVCLFFHRGEKMFSVSKNELQPKAFISGQSRGYHDLKQRGSVDMVCVTFQPHGAKAFFDLPIHELFDYTVSLDDIHDPGLTKLQNQLTEATGILTCVRLLESFLMKRLNIVKPHNYARMSEVIQSIQKGQTDIEDLIQSSCLGYKQFKRIFSEYVGANPKDFLRIVRFQKGLHILQLYPERNLTQLAFDSGYYDQSHLIKEFKTFSGCTPGEYITAYPPYSDYFT